MKHLKLFLLSFLVLFSAIDTQAKVQLGPGLGISAPQIATSSSSSFISPVVDYDAQGTLFYHMRPRDETTITKDGSDNVTQITDYNGGSGKIVNYVGSDVKSGTRTAFNRNVLDFDGGLNSVLDMHTSMSGFDSLLDGEYTLYFCVGYDSASANDLFMGAEASGGPDRFWGGAFKIWQRNSSGTIDEEANLDTYPHIVVITGSNTDNEIAAFQDNVEFTDSPAAKTDMGSVATVTLGGLNETGANTPNMYMEDLLIYSGVHNSATITTVANSLSYECNIPLPEHDYVVFALFGQSNMSGQSQEAIESQDQPYNPYITQIGRNGSYDERTIAAVQELAHAGGADGPSLGMQAAIDYAAANPNDKILFAAAAEGNTGLITATDWNKGDTNYEDAKDRTNTAMSYGTGTKTLKSIFFHQGENDSAASQSAYATALDQMIFDFRNDITGATQETPFIVGQLAPNFTASGVKAALTDTPNRVLNTAFVDSTGLTDRGDNTHFDRASLRTLGSNYYTAFTGLTTTTPTTQAQWGNLLIITWGNGVNMQWSN